jgi:hypothetical protein
MRKEQSYIKEYGPKAGPIIYKLLQKEAAHARWKDTYRKRLKQCQEQVKKLKSTRT